MSYSQYRPSGFRLLTPVIKNLLIINGIFFLARFAIANAYQYDIIDVFALKYPFSNKFSFWQPITYMFMHADLGHIFFNMFALWMFGKPLEERFGAKRFLTYYLITGVGAALTFYIAFYFTDIVPLIKPINSFISDPSFSSLGKTLQYYIEGLQSSPGGNTYIAYQEILHQKAIILDNIQRFGETPEVLSDAVARMKSFKPVLTGIYPGVVGASGSVYGILLAFGMLWPNAMIYLYFLFPIKAKWFVIIFGALELYLAFSQPGSTIAHIAHVGGMIFGFILIKIWNRRNNQPKRFY
ncbi:MAG: rhomboid family intramembrane serine protease [Bacteroidales bacterium]|nr:rhomboid family intramembrane serine protease [Bacteroidales bacterium]